MIRAMHHLPEELMLSYAAGSCGEGEALLVATHLTLCPRCRADVRQAEEIAGELLLRSPGWTPCSDLLESTRRRLEDSHPCDHRDQLGRAGASPAFATAVSARDPVLPRPLLSYTGALEDIAWRSRLFGILRYVELPISTCGVPVRLKRIKRNAAVPRHSHGRRELELYLAGGARDTACGKRYARGDVSVYERGEPHELKVDPDEDCLLLCVHSAPLLPTTLFGRVVYGFLGWS